MTSLTSSQRASYLSDGVILVRGAVDPAFIEPMLRAVDRVTDPARPYGLTQRMHATDPDFARFATDLGLAELAADATGSQRIRIYFDQVFVKEAGTDAEFEWHQDHPYWPIGGTQVASTWVALTAATAETSALEFVKGSHRWNKTYRPVGDRDRLNELWDGFGDMADALPDRIIDFENHAGEYEIIGYPVEPGDVLLFDYRILHRSRGNPSPNRRVAVSWRWLGDDATWQWERGKDPLIDQNMTDLRPGDRITDDTTFPIVFDRSASSRTTHA